MKKAKLKQSVQKTRTETQTAIQTIMDNISAKGVKKKLLKVPEVASICERYEINTEE